MSRFAQCFAAVVGMAGLGLGLVGCGGAPATKADRDAERQRMEAKYGKPRDTPMSGGAARPGMGSPPPGAPSGYPGGSAPPSGPGGSMPPSGPGGSAPPGPR